MAIKRLDKKSFETPAELNIGKMSWTVKQVATGIQRRIDDLVVSYGLPSNRTWWLYQAFVSFGGSTFKREDETGLMFPNGIDEQPFFDAFDELETPVQDWIFERVWEVNPQFRPLWRTSSTEEVTAPNEESGSNESEIDT